jgi:hypothetical protein
MDYINNINNLLNKFSDKSLTQVYNILNITGNDLCLKIYLVIALLVIHISVAYIFIKCLLYSIYFIYYRLTLIFRKNPSLYQSPLFGQMDDFSYYNQYFSYETYTIRYLFCILLVILGLTYINSKTSGKLSDGGVFSYYKFIIIFIVIVFILIVTYIFMNLSYIIRINNILNNLNKKIYDNLNIELLPLVCDYTENKKNTVDFSYGKCNNIRSDKSKLWEYISTVALEMNSKYGIDNMISFNEEYIKNPEKAKKEILLKWVDDNDVSYYDKILRAMVTHSLINYFIENNLRYEGGEFFSIYNTINSNIIEEFLKKRLNPFLYLKTKNLMLINYIYKDNISSLLNDNIFNLLKNDYDEIKDEITNGIIEAHDLFYYSITPAGYIYVMITIIGFLLIYAKSKTL